MFEPYIVHAVLLYQLLRQARGGTLVSTFRKRMYPLIPSNCVFLATAPESMFDKRFVALPMMTAFVRSASVRQMLEKAYS